MTFSGLGIHFQASDYLMTSNVKICPCDPGRERDLMYDLIFKMIKRSTALL